MQHSEVLNLKVADRQDVVVPMAVLSLLIVVSFALGPYPAILTPLVIMTLVFGCLGNILGIFKVSDTKLILIIFQDGSVRLKSESEVTIEGHLGGQQWCTHRFAVLQIVNGARRRRVLLSKRLQFPGEFRRLNMWLRQGFYRDAEEQSVSGVWPVNRA